MPSRRALYLAAAITLATWAAAPVLPSNGSAGRKLPRTHSVSQNLPPIGEMEIPEYSSTVTEIASVSGWALDYEEPVVTVRVYVDDQQVGQAEYPSGERPDIQADFPDVPHSLKSGFRYLLDTTRTLHHRREHGLLR